MASTAFSPLRHRNFVLTLSSSLISASGTWMQSVTLGTFLFTRTHSYTWMGYITIAAWGPAIIAAPLGGVIAERWNRQNWIQFNNLVMALCATTLALCAFQHVLTPWLILSLALVEGFSSASSWAAWQSLLPDLVERDEVLAAVSLSSAQFNLGRMLGPALAGVVLIFGPFAWCFAINAATFVYVFVVFFFVRTPDRARNNTPFRSIHEAVVGARAAWGNDACRHAIISVFSIACLLGPFISQIPAMAIGVLHGDVKSPNWLVIAQGAGAITAAFTLPTLAHRTSRFLVLRASIALLCVFLLVYGFAPTQLFAYFALFVLGGAYMGAITGLNASVQLHAPVAERSRILSLYTTSLSVGFPVGSIVWGVLADQIGLREVTIGAAVLGVTGFLFVIAARPEFLRSMGVTPRAAVLHTIVD